MLIDTHCHLDAQEFDIDRDFVANSAADQGVRIIVIPSVQVSNFSKVRELAAKYSFCSYALGIHPMYVNQANLADLEILKESIQEDLTKNKPIVAVGEIGLDYFIENNSREIQEYFFVQQRNTCKNK